MNARTKDDLIARPHKPLHHLANTNDLGKRERRKDLQGIRAIAITAVLLFHFFPKYWPNGHVGVDEFFVLSGFLMSLIADRQANFGYSEIASFYYRRIKRILPCYFLTILLSLLFSQLLLPVDIQALNMKSAMFACSFTTNLAAIDESREYERMLQDAEDLFTHTWSIAVEVQFYTIFPLLFLIQNSVFVWAGISPLIVVGLMSLYHYLTTSPTKAFNLVQYRIWQFVLGMCIQQQQASGKEFSSVASTTSLILASVITEFFEKPILRCSSKRIIIYTIMCICAPIVIMMIINDAVKYMDMERRWVQQLFTPKCSNSQVATANCDLPFFGTRITTAQAIRINRLFSFDDEKNLIISSCTYDKPPGPWGWCHFPSSNSTVRRKLLVLGNSYASNQGKVIYDACAKDDVDAAIYTVPVCESFVDHKKKEWCRGLQKDYMEAIASYKPDILFLLFRHLTWMDTPKTTIPDPLVERAIPVLKAIEKLVKHRIFILNAIPRVLNQWQKTYHASLYTKKPMDLEDLLYDNATTHYDTARWRIEVVAKSCQKCSVIDYVPLFTVNGTFNFVDERTNVAYMNDAKHFTPYGLYYLYPLYKDVCDKID